MHSIASASADQIYPDHFSETPDIMSSPGKASPQRLHHPTPVSPPRRFGRVLPLNEEDQEGDFNTVALDHTFSTSISSPKASDMTLAAVAAAATVANEAIYSQVHDTQQPVTQEVERQGGNVVGSPVRAEIAQTSPGPKRLFIHPYPRNHVMTAPLGSAPLSASEMSMATPATSAISALSSAATFSTHDPPTPSTSASVMMMDFAAASKASANTTGAGASAGYVRRPADHSMPPPQAIRIPPRKLQDGQQGYQNPPQTAPLPARSSSYDEHNHPQPPTPASAYPNLHYAQFPISSALAAAAEHHSSYPGPSALASAVQFQPELPPPGTFSYPSTYAGSPFHAARTFPPVNSPEYIGHPQPLPPIRGFSSHRQSATSPVMNSPHQIVSPLPTHMSIGLDGHPAQYVPSIPGLHLRPFSLDEEVKNIEAHSGATSFISKLWFLLSQPQEFGEYIRWTVNGKAFILSHNSPTFGEAILSRFFRHSNIASFIRQLNLYKMQRMTQLALLEDLNDSGAKVDGELCHTGFSHPHLQRGHPEMLHMIKPHCPPNKRTKKNVKASEACDELSSPPLSSGRKTRTASCSTGSNSSR